jgi:hypothetical protein
MKTQTRSEILKLIDKNGPIRPFELCAILKLSNQAIHRHLKSLVEQGIVELKGTPPFTQYLMAGIPNLVDVSNWLTANLMAETSKAQVSETRDVFVARLSQLKSQVKKGLPLKTLPIVIATTGEIGNNSFDHNIGQWRDIPGCWFEFQVTGKHLWICIADRGQGIFKSLSKTHPELKSDQAALTAAFEKVISGRSPEKRGNGLKFVKDNISKGASGGLACISGNGRIHYGSEGLKCAALLDKKFTKVRGTITLIGWSFL